MRPISQRTSAVSSFFEECVRQMTPSVCFISFRTGMLMQLTSPHNRTDGVPVWADSYMYLLRRKNILIFSYQLIGREICIKSTPERKSQQIQTHRDSLPKCLDKRLLVHKIRRLLTPNRHQISLKLCGHHPKRGTLSTDRFSISNDSLVV